MTTPAGLPDNSTDVCDECGFDYSSISPAEAPAAIRGFGRRFRAPLTRFLPGEDGDALVRARPSEGVWSALEYAAHVRDVFAWYDERVRRSLVGDRPSYEGPDPDKAAVEGNYNAADPVAVADELATNAEAFAVTLESLTDDEWESVHLRRGEERVVVFAARKAVHEGNHHLLDIGRGMRTLRATHV